ncbi:MAG TPA: DNA mismatch repair endonuclease MutL [Ktedonobacteraceae bacterium]|jgi:DNA mismatch repair protein MutL
MFESQEGVCAPILPLPPEVAERIAAGEVIERPVSVVKELLENALDAGARELRVEVRGGGLRLVRVIDDGTGIPPDQLQAACARHCTSKIRRVEDLERLHTLGFRGEALASIAAVAELTLLSLSVEGEKQESEQAASLLVMRGGEVVQHGLRARLRGTTVTVRDLFYNVPARLKFMHHARAEAGQILHLVRRYALGYPAVRFTLQVEEQVALQTSGSGSLSRALTELYHVPLAEMLNPLAVSLRDQERVSFELEGCVGNRALAQNNRQHLTLFINGRWVQARSLQETLEHSYRGLLPRGKHPLLVLHLRVPAAEQDANVHPAKTEVKLLHEREIAAAVGQALRTVLERSPALPESTQLPGPVQVLQSNLPGTRRRGLRVAESAGEYRIQEALACEAGTAEILRVLRPLAQLQQAVILAEAPDGSLYLVDQHRAHERVIYEQLRQRYLGLAQDHAADADTWDASLLLEPMVVELKRHEAELFEQRLPVLRGLGLDCERFGGRSFLVRAVPGGVGQEQLAAYLPELTAIAAEDSQDWQDRLLVGLACRSALRRGQELGCAEQRTLLASLARVRAPAVCPHGSPILLHYSRAFLSAKFEW